MIVCLVVKLLNQSLPIFRRQQGKDRGNLIVDPDDPLRWFFEFRRQDPSGAWATVQEYGSSDTHTWNTESAAEGVYLWQLRTRETGSTVEYEASADSEFLLSSETP